MEKSRKTQMLRWALANRHHVSMQHKNGKLIISDKQAGVETSIDVPHLLPAGWSQEAFDATISQKEMTMRIPLVARPAEQVYYCDASSYLLNGGDIDSNIHEVLMWSIKGNSFSEVKYAAVKADGNIVAGDRFLFYRTREEAVNFLETICSLEDIADVSMFVSEANRVSWTSQLKDKVRFPYYLTCKFKVNEEQEVCNHIDESIMVGVESISFEYMKPGKMSLHTIFEYKETGLFVNNYENYIDVDINGEYSCDGHPVKSRALSFEIPWNSFEIVNNN